jgi:adenine-specific DNA-methyltransferase
MEVPQGAAANYGEVFTKRWVVDLILDLVGYVPGQRDLSSATIVDPACGDGAFVLPIVERLCEDALRRGRHWGELTRCVRATDLQAEHVATTRARVDQHLQGVGVPAPEAERLATAWVTHEDFLLSNTASASADFVVGNPPYIRLEDVAPDRQALYRRACATMTGRSDIYVGFYEAGLRTLTPGGRLGYICADRWMKNSYGQHLRKLVGSLYSVEVVLQMHDVDAFAEQVAAYPAITIITRVVGDQTVMGQATSAFGENTAAQLVGWIEGHPPVSSRTEFEDGTRLSVVDRPTASGEPWATGDPDTVALVRRLEESLPPLEEGATKIGIGVATGSDKIFITDDASLVEAERLVPLVMTSDIRTGSVVWGGRYLVNPWEGPGRLVDLKRYPRLGKHFSANEALLRKRHTAQKNLAGWYRTIDPVHVALTAQPKLLFPDMKMESRPVLDDGGHYPHHNLYYVVSDDWDLAELGALLTSTVAQAFIEAYAVRMRGGTLRFQAQYLRRIRVPRRRDLSQAVTRGLKRAFLSRDMKAIEYWARHAYGVDTLTSI